MAKEQQYDCGTLFYADVQNIKTTSLGNNKYMSKTEFAPISKVDKTVIVLKEKGDDIDISHDPNYNYSIRGSMFDSSSRGKVVGKRQVFKKVGEYKKKFKIK